MALSLRVLPLRLGGEFESKLSPEFVEFNMPQVLSEHIRGIIVTVYEEDFNFAFLNDLANVMVTYIDMFGSCFSDWV